jgi:hypothetical protein
MASNSAKQKLYRDRKKAGRCVWRVEGDEVAVEERLEREGLLDPMSEPSADDVARALSALLAKLLRYS